MASKKSTPNPASQIAHMVAHVSAVRATVRECETQKPSLGMDLSLTHTGVVVLTTTGAMIANRTVHFPIEKRPSEANKLQRLLNTTGEIVWIAEQYKVGHVALEDYAFAAKFKAHQIGEIGGLVKANIYLKWRSEYGDGIICRPIPIKKARLRVLGYAGSLEKEDILEVVQHFVPVVDHHQADAWIIALAHFIELTIGVVNAPDKRKRKTASSGKKKRGKAGSGVVAGEQFELC